MMPEAFRQKLGIRGFLKIWIISILKKKPATGYQIMQSIKNFTNGAWKPTPGAIYPALETLQEMGWISGKRKGNRNQIVYSLTPRGKVFINETRKKFMERSDKFRFRNIIDSLIWEDEPKELRDDFGKLFENIVRMRNLMNRKYAKKNVNKARKLIEKVNKDFENFKLDD